MDAGGGTIVYPVALPLSAGRHNQADENQPRRRHYDWQFARLRDDLLKRCWLDGPVAIARRTRHALSHAGGRETEELKNYRPEHRFEILGGELQVKASDTRQLFDQLKGRVYALAEKAVTMRSFQ